MSTVVQNIVIERSYPSAENRSVRGNPQREAETYAWGLFGVYLGQGIKNIGPFVSMDLTVTYELKESDENLMNLRIQARVAYEARNENQ